MDDNIAKNAFFTVVYPAVEPFLADFFASLQRQTYPHFTVVVFNDGITRHDFVYDGLDIDVVDCSGSPASIRQQGIEYLIANNYTYVVFGDSDDYFAPERVDNSLTLLQRYDVVVNDVTLVDRNGQLLHADYFSSRIGHLEVIDRGFVADRNVFGLSNTAARISCMQGVDCPEELVAADWYLFSRALLNGGKAVFSTEGCTFYRQHGSNIAGFQQLTPARALAGVRCKFLHYTALSRIDNTCSQKASAYTDLFRELSADESRLQQYSAYLEKRRISNPFWWEDIVLPEETI